MKPTDPDAAKGAIEGDRPNDVQQGNANAGALDENGLPKDMKPVCEDAIGAVVDNRSREGGVSNAAADATETGKTDPDSPTESESPKVRKSMD